MVIEWIRTSWPAMLALGGVFAIASPGQSQTARTALDTYDEGPVWQIMTFRAPPGQVENQLGNIALVWEQQLKVAVESGVLEDYKVLTRWSASPTDWNIMVVEIFPNWASYDTFWEDWLEVDEKTVYLPEFEDRFGRMVTTGTEFLGTLFAREVFLKSR